MGIVINQPVDDITVGDLVEQIGMQSRENSLLELPVYRGGPVQTERGFVLHQPLGQWESSLKVADTIGVSTSNDIIRAIAQGNGPRQCLIALGYAGWGAGQLEQEMAQNSWLSGPADAQIIFNTNAEKRWEQAAKLLGVDIHQLTGDAGHA